MSAKTKQPVYRPEFCIEVAQLAPLGCRDKDIALFFGVEEETVRTWRRQHPEFAEAIARANFDLDLEVARALYEAALAGDINAIAFWLQCRCSGTWGGSQSITAWQAQTSEISKVPLFQ